MSSDLSRLRVAPVESEQVSQVISFLRQEFVRRMGPEVLRMLFEYHWTTVKPNLGFALWLNQSVVGFIGALYADRFFGGRTVRMCNLSTWYVRPEFRGAALKLLYAVISQQDYSVTNLSASPEVSRIMEALRFRTIERYKRLYLPWQVARELCRPSPDILCDPKRILDLVDHEDRTRLRDHLPYRLKHYLLHKGDAYSYLVLKRRWFHGDLAFNRVPVRLLSQPMYPCMEFLFLSNPHVAFACWARLFATILRRERALGIIVPERFLSEDAPPGVRVEQPAYLLDRAGIDGAVDSLYSELVILPI